MREAGSRSALTSLGCWRLGSFSEEDAITSVVPPAPRRVPLAENTRSVEEDENPETQSIVG